MILDGWCEKCHKFKRVIVSNRSLMLGGRVPYGICRSCQDKEDKKRG